MPVGALLLLALGCLRTASTQGGYPSDYDSDDIRIGPNLPDPLPSLISNMLSHSEAEDAAVTSSLNSKNNVLNIHTLRYVAVMTRHGSRSPTVTYPTDPYPYTNGSSWPDGPGQLTRYGKQQLYASGQTLRMRYNGYLNLNYFPNDTLVRTNRYDRDFMSAACLLAGLYPPISYQLWSPVIIWQPIPIWEDPFDIADIATRNDICPRFKEEQRKAINELNKHSGRYKKLFSYLSKHTGMNVTRISEVIEIWDVLALQAENGFKLPAWTKRVFPNKLARLYAVSFAAMVAGTSKMISLGGGEVLKMISHQLMQKSQGRMQPSRLLFIDAVHDATLQALLSALGFEDPFPIETSAFMVFELHESPSSGQIVQVRAFIIATLLHDIDHPGFGNQFISYSKNPLCQLYGFSYLEHHHVHIAKQVVEKSKLFSYLNEREYKSTLKLIEKSILDTDLATYFVKRQAITELLASKTFDVNNRQHRNILISITMTSADLSGQCKPFEIAALLCRKLIKEQQREALLCDRLGLSFSTGILHDEESFNTPHFQIQFNEEISLPCFDLLRRILTNVAPIYLGCLNNTKIWKKVSRGEIFWDTVNKIFIEQENK